jgi:hypothetical protein
MDMEKNVEFQHITSDKIEKIIDKTNIKKPRDLITFQPVIKQCKPIVSNQLTSLINLSIDTGVFQCQKHFNQKLRFVIKKNL